MLRNKLRSTVNHAYVLAWGKVLWGSQTCADEIDLRITACGSIIFHLGITDHNIFTRILCREEFFFCDVLLRAQNDAFPGESGKTETGELGIKCVGVSAAG